MRALPGYVFEPWWPIMARTALVFRQKAQERGSFQDNLAGGCMSAGILVPVVLRAFGHEALIAQGRKRGLGSHVWNVVNGWHVDITATQFGFCGAVEVRRAPRILPSGTAPIDAVAPALRKSPTWHHADPRYHVRLLAAVFEQVTGKPGLALFRELLGRPWGDERQRMAAMLLALDRGVL